MALDEASISAAFREGPHDYIELEGGRIAHWSFGDGPDLVFVHGWPLHGATWRRVLPHLVQNHTCHVLDMPAVGFSEWHGPMGILERSETIASCIDALKLGQFGFVGHDSGGSIARFIAADRPEQVTSIVLGNTEIPGLGLPGLGVAQFMLGLPGAKWSMKTALSSKRLQKKSFESCFTDTSYIEGDFSSFFVEPLLGEGLEGHLRFAMAIDWSTIEEDLVGAHTKITCPVLLIWGERDPWFPWKKAQQMVDSFGGPPAQVHSIPDGKLFIHEDHADEFARVTGEFLAEVEGL